VRALKEDIRNHAPVCRAMVSSAFINKILNAIYVILKSRAKSNRVRSIALKIV
jgi:hypothetical protein